MERLRARVSGALFICGAVCFWVTWALMPIPGTRDPAFILQAVSEARGAVLLSCVFQLVSAAGWAAALVLVPGPRGARGQWLWWGGVCALAVGMTGNAADAIYHLAAYELTHPEVPAAIALPVMTRIQGPDLLLLLPSVGAFFAGIGLLAVAAVRIGLVPRVSLLALLAATGGVAGRVLLPGATAPRVAGLLALACLIAPIAWMGWALLRRTD